MNILLQNETKIWLQHYRRRYAQWSTVAKGAVT